MPAIIAPVIPEIIIAFSALLILVYAAFSGDKSVRTAWGLSITSLFLSAIYLSIGASHGSVFNNMLVIDEFGQFVKLFIVVTSGLFLTFSKGALERHKILHPEYFVLMLFAVLGSMLMASACDMISLYAGLELQGLSLYVLAAFRRDDVMSSEAGLKYFVLGSLASGVFLYGASIIYGYTGATGFAEIAGSLSVAAPPPIVIFAMVFICVALAFKVSAVPFHMWAPDVYEGAPTPVTAFFAVVPKLAVFALFARVLVDAVGPLRQDWQQILIVLSILSMVVGGFAGLVQKSVKRLMAYSSISNAGFLLMALAIGDKAGIQVMLVYMVIYVLNTLGVFGVVLCLCRKGKPVDQLSDFSGFSKTHPILAIAMAVFLFSLAGIPPLAGFFGKYFVLLEVVNAGMLPLAVIGILMSVVSAFYYLRIIKIMYFDKANVVAIDGVPDKAVNTIMSALAILVGAFAFVPDSLVNSAFVASESLFLP